MTNLERRMRKLELCLTDSSGLVPHTRKWLLYWDRKVYEYMRAEPKPRGERFTLQAFRAVMKFMDDPASLVACIPKHDD